MRLKSLKTELSKAWNDLLKNPTSGKYSRKSVTWGVGMVIVLFIVGYGMISRFWPPEYIYYGLLAFVFGVSGLTVYDKYRGNDRYTHRTADDTTIIIDRSAENVSG